MRLFYIALGATAGVLIVRRLTRAAQQFTPEGVARNVSGAGKGLSGAVTGFVDEVRAGMAEREYELRSALGIDQGGTAS
ncbi:MAG: hypothetical protein QOG53_882 [Frankiales bacterium]|jgi:hypothetical protein|nr:hypothetical protein [Frankiales bacterium]